MKTGNLLPSWVQLGGRRAGMYFRSVTLVWIKHSVSTRSVPPIFSFKTRGNGPNLYTVPTTLYATLTSNTVQPLITSDPEPTATSCKRLHAMTLSGSGARQDPRFQILRISHEGTGTCADLAARDGVTGGSKRHPTQKNRATICIV